MTRARSEVIIRKEQQHRSRLQRENRFLKLPPELRNMVYEIVIEDSWVPYLRIDRRSMWSRRSTSRPLLQSCLEIRQEFSPLFYAGSTFLLDIQSRYAHKTGSVEWLGNIRANHQDLRKLLVYVQCEKGGQTVEVGRGVDNLSTYVSCSWVFTVEKRTKIGKFLTQHRRRCRRVLFDGTDLVPLAKVLTGRGIYQSNAGAGLEWNRPYYLLIVSAEDKQHWGTVDYSTGRGVVPENFEEEAVGDESARDDEQEEQ